ncbi:hypothetical protein Y1Q_0024700 [Alligator mississippiensis]|uniref:Uncharacterized protein n=1 Tax=Alligator mississippiensis TaxID=8496 RepID=A0A151PGV6_ALLMI|nr:hypothetical protein Y1Q_0024700 [Alligator mississippiensis]
MVGEFGGGQRDNRSPPWGSMKPGNARCLQFGSRRHVSGHSKPGSHYSALQWLTKSMIGQDGKRCFTFSRR